MASSGSFKTSYYKNLCLMLSWSIVQPQSIENNSTTIAWSLQGYRTDGATGMITCGGFKVVIDGTTVYSKSTDYRVNVYNGTVIASGTHTIAHNTDGTKSFSASAEAGIYYYEINASGTGTFTLDTIARASAPTVSASSVVMLNKVTITTNRKSSSFTHDLTYSFSGSTGTIATGVGASYEWTVPDLVSSISGKTSGTCTITCKTKNGSTVVGTKTVTLTLTIPAKSAVSASATTVQMGKSVTINTNRKSSGYTHTITYAIGTNSGTIATGVEASKAWTPPKSLAAYTGNKTSATCTITCTTYTGSTVVGTTTSDITLTVPAATVPTLSASSIVLGNPITIYTPREADCYEHDFSYTLTAAGSSTVALSRNFSGAIYDSYEWTPSLSLLAPAIPGATKGTITLTCKTRFTNSATYVGSNVVSFTITVPDNSTTKPSVTMSLSAVHNLPSAFNGVFVAGKSSVKASYEASSNYSTIASYLTKVNGATGNTNPYTSGVLNNSGTVTVTGEVADARGFVTKKSANIEVIPYSTPRVTPYDGQNKITCRRCNSDGTLDPGGTYLLIEAGRKYEKVISGGIQKNFCSLSYRWKKDADEEFAYSDLAPLLTKTDSSNYVSMIVPGIVSSNTTAYTVQIIAEDDAGGQDTVTLTVPTAFVTFHSPAGGHGFTLGGYHDPDKYDVFDCRFDAEFNGDVSGTALGLGKLPKIQANADFNDYKEFGAFAVEQDTTATTLANRPCDKAGTLRVWSANGAGRDSESKVYLIQEYVCYDNSATYRRSIQLPNPNSTWEYKEWKVTDGVDAILTQGLTDGWYWRKYANGIAECWRKVNNSSRDVTTQFGNMYYGNCDEVTFPFTFYTIPMVNATVESVSAFILMSWQGSDGNGYTTVTKPASYRVVRPTSITGATFTICYHAIGRWK